VSAKSKGNQFEIEAKNQLEMSGWQVFRCHRKPIFMKGRMITKGADIFGCDLVAKKLGEKSRWIQVSVVGARSAKVKQVLIFPWTLEYEQVELWLRVKGNKNFRKFMLMKDGYGELEFVEYVGRDMSTDNNEIKN